MGFTTVAYSMQRVGATAALTVITPVADAHVTINGNTIVIPPKMNKLMGAASSYGTGLAAGAPTLAQLQSPALRRVFNQDISRMMDTLAEFEDGHINAFPYDPLPLDEGEGLTAWSAHGALALGETSMFVFLCDKPATPISGEIRTVRFTSVCAAATRVWTLGVLAATQQLPMGRYAVVGMKAMNLTDFGAVRLVFTDTPWRPGCIMTHSPIAHEPQMFRDGVLGEWGQFNWQDPPRIEVCSVLAAPVANPQIMLDVIKIA
jgi:hypothetical protein